MQPLSVAGGDKCNGPEAATPELVAAQSHLKMRVFALRFALPQKNCD